MASDRDYYERRRRQEQALATSAQSIEERHFHQRMAELYQERVELGGGEVIELRA